MGSKSSKREGITITPIDPTTMELLCRDTGFSEEELINWHQSFHTDCPDGRLSLRQFEHEYAKVMGKPTQKTANYIRHMFNVYDQDKNQFIDFREFVLALSAASVVNRLRLIEMLFRVFDLDNDGRITKDEIAKMLNTLVDVTDAGDKRRQRRDQRPTSQSVRMKQEEIQRRIDEAFDQLNTNADDHITKEEFIEWYMKTGLIADVQKSDGVLSDSSKGTQPTKKTRKSRRNITVTKSKTEDNETNGLNVRYMSRMIERKSPSKYTDDDDFLDENKPIQKNDHDRKRNVRFSPTTNDDISSERLENRRQMSTNHEPKSGWMLTSRDNDRWSLIMNSVFGQLRQQDSSETNAQSITTDQTVNNGITSRWKRKVSDTVEMDNLQRKPNGQTNQSYFSTSETDLTESNTRKTTKDPDIVTVRF